MRIRAFTSFFRLRSRAAILWLVISATLLGIGSNATKFGQEQGPSMQTEKRVESSCFLLYELRVGEVGRAPAAACKTRVSPYSTFKIAHALAALDAGVLSAADSSLSYDGSPQPFESWKRDHTLASAMHSSVVWYFQRVAEKLGEKKEHKYLVKFHYGNADSSSNLTSFWLGGSLRISPKEQEEFLVRLFEGKLPVSPRILAVTKEILVQPHGKVVNAAGEQPFGGDWPAGTVLRAKTGSGNERNALGVRWIIGHVSRGNHAWIFVSCVTGGTQTPQLAAVELAARSLHEAGVL